MTQVLRQLAQSLPPRHPDLIVGTETYDDAGVFRLSDDLALVQTVDFFPPLVNDPYDFGRIAAANALSDVYAMGGEPLTALNIVGFPDKELDFEVLGEILRGGATVCAAAGCTVVGGHSVRDAEVKFGLAVTGRVHPRRVWTNAGARPGDALVLTKPLGSGVLCSAAKSGKLPEEELSTAIGVMATLNRAARDAGVEVITASAGSAASSGPIHACTDVTGFGLVGHAFEMAVGSGATLVLYADAVPLLPRTLEFARLGVLTRAAKTTREHLGEKLLLDDAVEPALAGVLMDAQTSGGLLFSVAAEQAGALVAALERAGTPAAAIIGHVDAARPAAIEVRATAGRE